MCGGRCLTCGAPPRNSLCVGNTEGVVKGMEIKRGAVGLDQSCDVCTQGKFTQTRNREPDRKANKPLELVHTDLAGPFR